MKRIRKIHPSAALFVGILIAFTLPFGYSAGGCGPTTAQYTGVDLLHADVQPGLAGDLDDQDYATEIGRHGVAWSWLLLLSALAGLSLAVLKRGKLWATCCAISAAIAVGLAVDLELGEASLGWELALVIPLAGIVLKLAIALVRAGRRGNRELAAPVTPPQAPVVR